MKNVLLPIVMLFLASCSVEKDDLHESEIQLSDFNAIVVIDGCAVDSYNFENVGKIEVTNDTETLYVTIASTTENFDLVNTKLHVSNSESGFPTVGRGNLPPGKMEYNKDFQSNVKSYTFEFPLVDLGGCIFIASQSTFSNGEKSVTSWAGDINVKYGNWSYFQYCIQECTPACEDPVYTGPSVLTGSINYTEVISIESVDEARKFLANLILQSGYYSGTETELGDFSRYSPSIVELIDEFNARNEANLFDDVITTYSYGTGECAGTIELVLKIIDDRNNQ